MSSAAIERRADNSKECTIASQAELRTALRHPRAAQTITRLTEIGKEGMVRLTAQALALARNGATSLTEVYRARLE